MSVVPGRIGVDKVASVENRIVVVEVVETIVLVEYTSRHDFGPVGQERWFQEPIAGQKWY
jgi:hypothetical protein